MSTPLEKQRASERLSKPRQADSWIGSPLMWMRQYWTQKLESRVVASTQSDQAHTVANTFQLIDTLVELSEEALSKHPERAAERQLLEEYLERTISAQLEAALAEHRALPFHTGYAELDLRRFVLDGTLHIHHPGYRDKDLREYARNALPVAPTPEHKARYQREHDQLDTLYGQLWQELTSDGSIDDWEHTTAKTTLSLRVRRDLKLSDTDQVWVANKHALAMPRNKNVYADGLAYLNTYQLVYLPKEDRVILLMDHFYRDYDITTHAAMLSVLSPEPVLEPGTTLSEELVMKTIVNLSAELRDTPAFEVFCRLEDTFPLSPSTHATEQAQSSIQLRAEQQSKLSGLAHQRPDINQGAAFLAQVLITEYLVCRQFPEAMGGLTQRLMAAREPVMNFLLQGTSFSSEVLKKHYFETYLSEWLPKLNVHSQKNQPFIQLHQRLQNIQSKRDQLENMDSTHQAKREESILALAKTYPSILMEVSSQAQCALGSFGGLRNLNALSAANSSLGQQLLRGEMLSSSQLAQVIGAERAQDWRPGVCVNPECTLGGQEQLVGECGLCYSCEMAFNGLSAGETNGAQNDGFQDWLNTSYIDPMSAVRNGERYWKVNATDLPMYLWSGVR